MFVSASDMKVCKLKLTHIGSNYPCLRDPATGYMKGQNVSKIRYESAWKEKNKFALINFGKVANYGKIFLMNQNQKVVQFCLYYFPSGSGPYLKGHNLDHDTIQIAAFVTGDNTDGTTVTDQQLKYESSMAEHGNNNINKYENNKVAGTFKINSAVVSYISSKLNVQLVYFQDFGSEYTGEIEITATTEGGLDLIKGECKRIVFSYKFPDKKRYYATHVVENLGFDSGNFVTWCGLFLKKVP